MTNLTGSTLASQSGLVVFGERSCASMTDIVGDNPPATGHARSKSEDVWGRLNDLTKLSKLNIIHDHEFEERKRQLVDELTGTKVKGGAGGDPPPRSTSGDSGDGAAVVSMAAAAAEVRPSPAVVPAGSDGGNTTIQRQRMVEGPQEEPPAGALPHLRDKGKKRQSLAAGSVTLERHRASQRGRDGKKSKKKKKDRRLPPDFTKIRSQRAKLLNFNIETGRFNEHGPIVRIKIDPKPFARGNLRYAHHMLACLTPEDRQSRRYKHYVAKISIDPYEDPATYLDDVATQNCAREYAKMYNKYNPPKPVQFVEAFVLALVDRPGSPLCAVERYIDGTYKKHNNNWGFINDKDERNTPHAFSHFTYEASQHQLLICDIQGVVDVYTDPQIHSLDGEGFGKGNMGQRGFRKFFSTHKCNAICRFLKLPLINPKSRSKEAQTVPACALMESDRVTGPDLNFTGSIETFPTLPAFKSTCDAKEPFLAGKKGKDEDTRCQCTII